MLVFGNILDWVAFGWFITCWIGYTMYARRKARTRDCLAALLYQYRIEWMRDLLRHENRISDLALLGNLMHMVNFLASTTILVIAGLVTVLYSSDSVVELLSGHKFMHAPTEEQIQFRLLCLLLIFVYAFFRFTWAMRQHSFCSILIGAAPHVKPDAPALTEHEEKFALQLAKISDRAGHDFNYGLRSYYFALAFLMWFISPWALMFSCTLVVTVLYWREFKSKTLNFLISSRSAYEARKEACAAESRAIGTR
jgi:uncharacterized membrane protein